MSTLNSSSKNENIIFKSDGNAAIISEKLHSFYKDKQFFDTVLIAGSDSSEIHGHRNVLSAFSEYFFEIFLIGQTASKDNVVELKEIEAPTLKLVIDFMYSGWIELSLEKVDSILKTVAFLKIKTLVDGCSDFIGTHMSSRNCLKYLGLAKELNLSGLKEKSLNCTYTHFEEVSKENELLLLNEEELRDLLFNDNPHGDFEEHVFLAMVAWINYDKDNREGLTFQLLSMVRYQYLRPKFIVENRKSVCKTVESYELICSWLQWHLSPETRSADQQICVLKPRNGGLTAISYSDSYQVSFQTYNPKEDSWVIDKKTLLSKEKKYGSMIVIDEKLIVVGGGIEYETANSVECLDLHTFKWIDLPPMQKHRCRSQLAILNGNLCVYGGRGWDNGVLNSVEIYNFSERKWNSLEPPSKPSDYGRIVVHNGILHIIDFYNGCMQSYDVFSNRWVLQKFGKKELIGFGLAAVDRYLYVIGGCDLDDESVNTVSRFDLSNDTWCEVAALPNGRSEMKTLVVGNKIVIYGGSPETKPILIEEYNTETDSWKTLKSVQNLTQFDSLLCMLPINL